MFKGGFVYILTSAGNTVLYVGVTSDLHKRVCQHRHKHYPGSFTARYNCSKLVYYRFFERIEYAIAEEKRIKGGSRKQKIALIESVNADWADLWSEVQFW